MSRCDSAAIVSNTSEALARAGHAGEHRQPPLGDLDVDVLEVVHARAVDMDQVGLSAACDSDAVGVGAMGSQFSFSRAGRGRAFSPRELRELPLGVLVPTHALDGVLPPALHLGQRRLVRRVPRRDRVPEVLVLCLDHLVRGGAAERGRRLRRAACTSSSSSVGFLFRSGFLVGGCRAHRSCWIRTMLPAGSRTAQSRTPYGCSVGSWTTSSLACTRSKVPSRSAVARLMLA